MLQWLAIGTGQVHQDLSRHGQHIHHEVYRYFEEFIIIMANMWPYYYFLQRRFNNHPDCVATTRHMTVNVGVALDPSFGMWNSRYVFNHFDIPHRLQQMLQGASYSYWIRYTWKMIVVCYNLPLYSLLHVHVVSRWMKMPHRKVRYYTLKVF